MDKDKFKSFKAEENSSQVKSHNCKFVAGGNLENHNLKKKFNFDSNNLEAKKTVKFVTAVVLGNKDLISEEKFNFISTTPLQFLARAGLISVARG